MSITIHSYRSIESLADGFIQSLAESRASSGDLFLAQEIVIPQLCLKKWIELRIADKHGISIHHRYSFLEQFFWNKLKPLAMAASPSDVDIALADRFTLSAQLFSSLIRKGQDVGDLLADYVFSKEPKLDGTSIAKGWQLSQRLMRYFFEYEYNCPERMRSWLRGGKTASVEGIYAAEAKLFLDLFGGTVPREESGKQASVKRLTLPMLFRAACASTAPATAQTEAVHFYGIPHFSALQMEILELLSQTHPLHIHQLRLSAETHHPMVERWAKPEIGSVEHFKSKPVSWAEVSESPMDRAGDSSFLARLRQALKAVGETISQTAAIQDRSFQIAGCPSRRREVETVAAGIITNLLEDKSLQLHEIAVLPVDMELYRDDIRAVFDCYGETLSYVLLDNPPLAKTYVGKGALDLLDLMVSSYNRNSVLKVLSNPCFLKAMGASRDDLDVWIDWIERLNIFYGIDAAHKNRFLETGDGSLFMASQTWLQGLQRLRLGRICEAGQDASRSLFEIRHFRQTAPYQDLHSGDSGRIEKFTQVIETLSELPSLFSAAVNAEDGKTAAGWIEPFCKVIAECFEATEELPEEAAVKELLIGKLESLKEIPLPGMPFEAGIALLKEIASSILNGSLGGHCAYPSGGIAVGGLKSLMPIPFKMVYILGLGEGLFPGAQNPSSLDLRESWSRGPLDANQTEQNQFLFYEALHLAQKKLCLSYVNRNLEKDELLQPSSTLNELLYFIQEHFNFGEGGKFEIRSIPLHPYNRVFFEEPSPAWDPLANFSPLLHRIGMARLKGGNPRALFPLLKEKLGPCQIKKPVDLDIPAMLRTKHPNGRIPVTLANLEKFLKNPLECGLKLLAGINTYSIDEDLVDEKEDPLKLEYFRQRNVFNEAFEALLTEGDEEAVAQRIQECYRSLQITGEAPEGLFEKLDCESLLNTLETIRQKGAETLNDRAGFPDLRMIRFGTTSDESGESRCFPPITASLDEEHGSLTFQITGETGLCFENEEGITLIYGSMSDIRADLPDQALEPYLFHLLSSLPQGAGSVYEWRKGRPITFLGIHPKGVAHYEFAFEQDKAVELLKSLLGSLASRECLDYMPFKVLSSFKINGAAFTKMLAGEFDAAQSKAFDEALLWQVMEGYSSHESRSEKVMKAFFESLAPKGALERAFRRFQPLLLANVNRKANQQADTEAKPRKAPAKKKGKGGN